MQWLDLKVPPLLLWFVFAAAMFGAARVAPQASTAFPAKLPIAVAVLGGAVAFAGVVEFRRKRTTVNPLTPGESSSVVASGIYRVSRNPMYLGFLLVLAGWAVYLSNAVAAMMLPVFLGYLTQYQIKPEERALLAKFGPEFAMYMSRVRRWV